MWHYCSRSISSHSSTHTHAYAHLYYVALPPMCCCYYYIHSSQVNESKRECQSKESNYPQWSLSMELRSCCSTINDSNIIQTQRVKYTYTHAYMHTFKTFDKHRSINTACARQQKEISKPISFVNEHRSRIVAYYISTSILTKNVVRYDSKWLN